MSHWQPELLQRGVRQHPWLGQARASALAALEQRPFPGRKTENYRYLPMARLNRLQAVPADDTGFKAEPMPGLASLDLVFVNGRLVSDIGPLPEGLSIARLEQADSQMQAVFNAAKPDRHYFGLVNDMLAEDGVVIRVAADCKIETPIRLIHWQNGGEAHTRHLVLLNNNAALTLIEQHVGTSEASFNTSFCEYQINDGAQLQHQRFALQTGAAINFGGCHFNLGNGSDLNSTLVACGGDLSRLDVDINHCGQHAHALQNAIYLLGAKELFDLHTNVEHANPNGTTEQNVRGIVGDQGKAVFNGRIHIHRYAQKTLAELNNRNLLLTRNAEVYTKPELEIYADDVRCAHGATVAELDSKALYYLRSRGVSEADARIMLNFGFINELIEQIDSEPLQQWLQATLKDRFSNLRHQAAEQ